MREMLNWQYVAVHWSTISLSNGSTCDTPSAEPPFFPLVRTAASTNLSVLAVRTLYHHLIRYWSREHSVIKHNRYWVRCHGNVWTVRPPLNWPSVIRERQTPTGINVRKQSAHPSLILSSFIESTMRKIGRDCGTWMPQLSCHQMQLKGAGSCALCFAQQCDGIISFHGRAGKLTT